MLETVTMILMMVISLCHLFLKASIFSFSGFVLALVKVLAALRS